jgi:hypothetical protein
MKITYLFIVFLTLFLSQSLVFAGEDYYKLLGLKRDATEDQIKKAFKNRYR